MELSHVGSRRMAIKGRKWRRVATTVLAIFVGIGLTGLLGIQTETRHYRFEDGTVVSIDFPRIARPGLAVTWRLRINSPSEITEEIHVAISPRYLDSFDHNLFTPDASSIKRSIDATTFIFDPPESDSFEMSIDMRLEPGFQWKQDADVSVAFGNERNADFHYTTWVMP